MPFLSDCPTDGALVMPTAETEDDRVRPMLPLPGAPSSSWALFNQRVKSMFSGANLRVCISFWLFGRCCVLVVWT